MRQMLAVVLLSSLAFAQASKPAAKPATPKKSTASSAQKTTGVNPTAVIETTAGNFHCTLFKDKVPGAVNNFVGLATGTKDWTDPKTGQKVHGKPLYDGTIFHRVIPEFMIQGGDPFGNDPRRAGTGDPGYKVPDEFAPGLTFDQPGMLAYANSGPNTNGSQFFITEVPTPFLNPCLDDAGCTLQNGRRVPKGYGYTIIGQCDPASVELVKKVAREPRNGRDFPDNPVTIKHIAIQGTGAAAKPAAKKPATKSGTSTTKKPASSTPKQ